MVHLPKALTFLTQQKIKKKTKEDRSQVGLCRNEQTLPNQRSVRFFAFLEDTMTNSCALKFKIR